jgi:tetratricopeptide (TPR) repeat protein
MKAEKEADSSNHDAAGKKSRTYFLIAFVFLFAMALFWSVDSSIVYIFLGLASFFLFLAFYARPTSVGKSDPRSYRSQGQIEYSRATQSVEDKIKQIFQRTLSSTRAYETDPMAKGRKIALAVGAAFFVLFAIPFVAALFGSGGSSDSMSYYIAGQQHFEEQKYDSAYIEYKQALAIDPDYLEAIVGYGDVLVVRNERDSAIMMFDRALEIKPDYAEVTHKKAAVFYDQKKYNEAIGILTPMFIEQPQYYDAMLLMGDCYYVQKNYVDALSWYENAYQNGGERSANLCYLMAYIYDTRQEYERAISLYKEALEYDPTIADIYKRLGELLPGEDGNPYRAKAIEQRR